MNDLVIFWTVSVLFDKTNSMNVAAVGLRSGSEPALTQTQM